MTIERGENTRWRTFEVGQNVSIGVHYFRQGREILTTLCAATAGNPTNSGIVISAIRGGCPVGNGIAEVQCQTCDYREHLISQRNGTVRHVSYS